MDILCQPHPLEIIIVTTFQGPPHAEDHKPASCYSNVIQDFAMVALTHNTSP